MALRQDARRGRHVHRVQGGEDLSLALQLRDMVPRHRAVLARGAAALLLPDGGPWLPGLTNPKFNPLDHSLAHEAERGGGQPRIVRLQQGLPRCGAKLVEGEARVVLPAPRHRVRHHHRADALGHSGLRERLRRLASGLRAGAVRVPAGHARPAAGRVRNGPSAPAHRSRLSLHHRGPGHPGQAIQRPHAARTAGTAQAHAAGASGLRARDSRQPELAEL
mmetsp:Transcript_6212/g.19918  ORF Transcript_6212/g.19918 Transcript_6212/m.19918 type:complete len:220 (+) Transcript_6212:760-1419(+)